MIRASRIWMACEETNGTWVTSALCPGPLGISLSLRHTSLHPHAFCFPLTSRSQLFRRPRVSFLVMLARSFRFESFALLLPYLQCLPVSPVYLVSDKIEYVSDSTPRLQGHRGDSPLHDFPSVPPPELLPEATPVCQHATSSDFTLVSRTEAVHTAPFYVRVWLKLFVCGCLLCGSRWSFKDGSWRTSSARNSPKGKLNC